MILTILTLLLSVAMTTPASGQVAEIGDVYQKPAYVEQYVRIYFFDILIMAEIAECESRFRQFDREGNILRGERNTRDIGVMQINEGFHLNEALEKGINLYTLEGNLMYARSLYEKMGTSPWESSKKCWGGMVFALAQ